MYGLIVGFYRIFPFNQIEAFKNFVEQSIGFHESFEGTQRSGVTVLDTFLQRLLVKKVWVGTQIGSGGGITTLDNILYFVTNKGQVSAFDINNYQRLNTRIESVPMNLEGLNLSLHPYKNEFRLHHFRVNGVYSEVTIDDSHQLYVSHNSFDSNRDCITHNISRINLEPANSEIQTTGLWETIFTAEPCIDPDPLNWLAATPYSGHISGGNIVEFDPNHLLVSVGDYNFHGLNGSDEYALDESNPYGKLILVDKNNGNWSVFSIGNRNAAGLFIDAEGTIWASENGPMGGDELNIIEKGNNYGWPLVSLGMWYDLNYTFKGSTQRGIHRGFTEPVFSWAYSISPGNLIKIEGDKFQSWNGDIILSTRKDRSLRRLRLDESNRVLYDERIEIGHRIRDIKILRDETIVLFTDDGYLIFIEDGGAVYNEMGEDEMQRLVNLEKYDQFRMNYGLENDSIRKILSAREVFEYNCSTCHTLAANHIGPALENIFDRTVGELDDFAYSQFLKNDDRKWTPELMESFLMNESDEFSMTIMPRINLTPGEVDSIIVYLQ